MDFFYSKFNKYLSLFFFGLLIVNKKNKRELYLIILRRCSFFVLFRLMIACSFVMIHTISIRLRREAKEFKGYLE